MWWLRRLFASLNRTLKRSKVSPNSRRKHATGVEKSRRIRPSICRPPIWPASSTTTAPNQRTPSIHHLEFLSRPPRVYEHKICGCCEMTDDVVGDIVEVVWCGIFGRLRVFVFGFRQLSGGQ